MWGGRSWLVERTLRTTQPKHVVRTSCHRAATRFASLVTVGASSVPSLTRAHPPGRVSTAPQESRVVHLEVAELAVRRRAKAERARARGAMAAVGDVVRRGRFQLRRLGRRHRVRHELERAGAIIHDAAPLAELLARDGPVLEGGDAGRLHDKRRGEVGARLVLTPQLAQRRAAQAARLRDECRDRRAVGARRDVGRLEASVERVERGRAVVDRRRPPAERAERACAGEERARAAWLRGEKLRRPEEVR